MKGIGLQLIQDGAGVDLAVSGGALQVGGVLEQNQYMLLNCRKGEIREHPLVGVGLGDAVNDTDFAYWERQINQALEEDGQQVERLRLRADGLELKAKYK